MDKLQLVFNSLTFPCQTDNTSAKTKCNSSSDVRQSEDANSFLIFNILTSLHNIGELPLK